MAWASRPCKLGLFLPGRGAVKQVLNGERVSAIRNLPAGGQVRNLESGFPAYSFSRTTGKSAVFHASIPPASCRTRV